MPSDVVKLSRQPLIACAAIAFIIAAVLCVFGSSAHFGFLQWDDQLHLTANPFIQPDSPDRFVHFWRKPYAKLYIPVAYNAWAVIYSACVDPNGHISALPLHLANIGLHAFNSIVVFFLLRKLLASRGIMPALLGALLFAVHPLQVESVAWISEFRGLLSAAFGLSSMLAYVKAIQAGSPRSRWLFYFLSLLLLILAILCKPIAAAIPLIVLVIDRWILNRSWRDILKTAGPWVLLSLFVTAIMMFFIQASSTNAPPLWQRPFIAGDAITFYILKVIWPFDLCADYSRTPALIYGSAMFWGAWLFPAILIVGLLRMQSRIAIASLGVFIAALMPVLGLLPFEFQRISTVADRYAYLALLGPAILIALISSTKTQRWVTFAILAALSFRSIDQLRTWRDDHSLWTHAMDVNDRAVIATSNIAQQLADSGDRAEAVRLFERAHQVDPHRAEPLIGLAKLSRDAGDASSAESRYREAIAADPASVVARSDLGSLLAQSRRFAEAETILRDAIAIEPDFADAWTNLAGMQLTRGLTRDAIASARTALTFSPRHSRASFVLGLALDQAGDHQNAETEIRNAMRFDPLDPEPPRWLARRAMSKSQWKDAEPLLQVVIGLNPTDADALNDLGQVLAAENRVDEAINMFQRAIQSRPDLPALRENLESAQKLKQMLKQ